MELHLGNRHVAEPLGNRHAAEPTPELTPDPAVAPAAARRAVSRDVVLTFGGRIALTGAIIVGDVIVARTLGPEGKGAFVLVLALSSLGAVILGLGIDRSLGVLAARSSDVARSAFANALTWSAVIGGLGALAIFLLYGPPANGGHATGPLGAILPPLTETQLIAAALSLPFELAYSIGLLGMVGLQRLVAFNVLRFLRRGLLTVLLVAFAALGRVDLQMVLWLNLAAAALTVIAILWAISRSHMLSLRLDPALLVKQLSFGGRIFVGTIAERLHFRANTFLLTALVSVAATGVFSVALGLGEILWYLPSAVGVVLFSRAVRNGRESAAIASALTRTMLAVMILGSIPLWLIAPTLIEVVYGAPFRDAGVALQIMLPGVLAYSIVAVLSNPLIAWGAPGRVTAVLISGLVVNLAANLLLIPQFGMNGAALATTISYTAAAALILLLFRRLSGQSLRQTLIVRGSDVRSGWTELRGVLRLSRTPSSARLEP